MHTSVPLWLFVIVSALALSSIGAAAWFAYKSRRKREAAIARPTTAEIMGFRWCWHYRDGEVRDLASYCPKCDSEIHPTEENRHGKIHLISFRCDCVQWRSQSFQCSHAQLIKQVFHAIREETQ